MSRNPFRDCAEFSKRVVDKKKIEYPGIFDEKHLQKQVGEEFDELKEAIEKNDRAMITDACIDMMYYVIQHITTLKDQTLAGNGFQHTSNATFEDLIGDLFSVNSYSFYSKKPITYTETIISSLCSSVTEFLQNPRHFRKFLRRLINIMCRAGIDYFPIWQLVHNANMTKFGPDSRFENGKLHKGPNFVPPDDDIRKEIERQDNEMPPFVFVNDNGEENFVFATGEFTLVLADRIFVPGTWLTDEEIKFPEPVVNWMNDNRSDLIRYRYLGNDATWYLHVKVTSFELVKVELPK